MDSTNNNSSTKFIVSATLNVVLIIALAIVGFLLFDANRTLAGKELDLAAARQDVLLAKTERANETARVAELKSDLAKVQTEAQQASTRSEELSVSLQQESAKAQATAAELEAEKSRLPAVPVRVEFRKAALNNTLVGVFINTSSKHLPIVVAMRNNTTGRASKIELQLAPGGRAEIGHLEGWGFASGDELAIVSSGYEVGKVTAP